MKERIKEKKNIDIFLIDQDKYQDFPDSIKDFIMCIDEKKYFFDTISIFLKEYFFLKVIGEEFFFHDTYDNEEKEDFLFFINDNPDKIFHLVIFLE